MIVGVEDDEEGAGVIGKYSLEGCSCGEVTEGRPVIVRLSNGVGDSVSSYASSSDGNRGKDLRKASRPSPVNIPSYKDDGHETEK